MRQPPSKGSRRLNLLYGAQVDDAAAALPLHRQRSRARHARLRLLGREPAARAVRAGGRAGGDRLPRSGREDASSSSARARGGRAFASLLASAATTSFVATRATIDDAPYEEADLVVIAVPSSAFGEVLGTCAATRRCSASSRASTRRPATRLSTLVHGPAGRGALRAEHGGGGRGGPARRDGDRVARTRRSRCACRTRSTRGSFRVYVNTDLIGVELCGAAKNVIALAAGGVDGLGLGDNAKAALITRGLVEMARLGEACGAEPETFSGLAGMGDLIVTCFHPLGRNRRAGELIARGATPDEARAADRPGRRRADDRAGAARPVAPHRRRAADHRRRLRGARRACRSTSSPASLMGRRPTEE